MNTHLDMPHRRRSPPIRTVPLDANADHDIAAPAIDAAIDADAAPVEETAIDHRLLRDWP